MPTVLKPGFEGVSELRGASAGSVHVLCLSKLCLFLRSRHHHSHPVFASRRRDRNRILEVVGAQSVDKPEVLISSCRLPGALVAEQGQGSEKTCSSFLPSAYKHFLSAHGGGGHGSPGP